jgi:hypothetical protein
MLGEQSDRPKRGIGRFLMVDLLAPARSSGTFGPIQRLTQRRKDAKGTARLELLVFTADCTGAGRSMICTSILRTVPRLLWVALHWLLARSYMRPHAITAFV